MEIKPLRQLHDTLVRSAERYPEKTALFAEGTGYSYAALLDFSMRLAAVYKKNGLQRGDRVAIFLDNNISSVIALYATLFAGGAFVIINPQTKTDKLEYIISNSDARIFVSEVHLSSIFTPLLPRLKNLTAFFYAGNSATPLVGDAVPFACTPLWSAIEAASPISHPAFTIPNDLAALIYTSGSTGQPKGVMMSHSAMLFAAQSIAEYLRLDHTHTIINVLPQAFDYGLYQLLMTILLGATLVLERSFIFPAKVLNVMAERNVTVFPGVPTIYATLIGMHRRKKLLFPSVLRITNTAAALPTDYNQELHEIFPNALIYRMYGLTECKRVCYLEPELADVKPESVGKAIPGTDAFILSPEGNPVKPGEVGILHVRGPHVMMGYWNDPAASQKALKDGPFPGEKVLCTHDWFTTDSDGDLYFKGRGDDVIKSRGEKIYPVEVENVLLKIKGIREVAVIGVADESLGQSIKAFIAVDNASVTKDEILRYCSNNLENFMVPKHLEFVDSLPKTKTGKISKKDLR